ncbi:LPS-assembly protein LptD, partial [Kaarinaea lacus]
MATPVSPQPFKTARPARSALGPIVFNLLLLAALPSYAQQPASWEHCAAQFVPQELLAIKKAPAPVGDNRIYIFADNASIREQEYFNLHGDVEIQQGDFIVRAEHMDYQRSTNLLNAQGEVRFDAENLIIVGEKATMAMGQYQGSIESSQVWLEANHLRGEAQRLEFLDKNRVNLHKALITSCNLGQDDWLLKASELRLDSIENEAVAKHARLELLGVPVLYSPYLSFPISGRKSGFLAPDMGISNKSGFELGLPYYWNIAPHRDATITPYYYDKRGTQLKSEFRYLNRHNRGSVYGEYLPKDKSYDADRGYAYLQHSGELVSGLSTSLEYRYVSDKDYLNDFGGQLGVSSLTHLERYLNFDYRADKWRAKLFVQAFQTLDDSLPVSDQPYRRLPQIRFDTKLLSAPYGFSYKLDTELVHFDREDSLTARRVDLLPMLQWQQRSAFGYVRPKLSYRHTRYSLEKNHPDTDPEPIRSVPTFSFDSGLFFDRATTLGSAKVHTLEPRLFYLYVPYREQSNLVVDEDGNE